MGGSKASAPTMTYSTPPASQEYTNIQKPWMESQYGLYQSMFEPMTRSLGGKLGADIEQPMQLPQSVWDTLWQQTQGNIVQAGDIERQGLSEFAAGNMMGSGAQAKEFQGIGLRQTQNLEQSAIEKTIRQWNEQKQAKQQAYQNAFQYMSGQPQFNIPYSTSQGYLSGGGGQDNTAQYVTSGIGLVGSIIAAI